MSLLYTMLLAKVPLEAPTEPCVPIFREQCWILVGKKIGKRYFGKLKYQGEGDFAQVEFDWTRASGKDVLGFYHTHPYGYEYPSTKDDRTMSALVRSEGRPLLCGVLTERSNKCYIYYRDKDKTIGRKKLRCTTLLGRKFFTAIVEE